MSLFKNLPAVQQNVKCAWMPVQAQIKVRLGRIGLSL